METFLVLVVGGVLYWIFLVIPHIHNHITGRNKRTAEAVAQSEADDFIRKLKAMDGDGIGMIVALATHLKHRYIKMGEDVSDPQLCMIRNPDCRLMMNNAIKKFQDRKEFPEATATMVWLFTLRAADDPGLRQSGRDMWRELERGFPHVEAARMDVASMTGYKTFLDIDGYDQFPIGLTPEPL